MTFRLHDSVPLAQVERWKDELGWHSALCALDPICAELRRRVEAYEDAGYGECYLKDPRIHDIVKAALFHFDGERYRLLEWCIMPNHVHVLIEAMAGHPLDRVVHSWKSFTGNAANRLLGRQGPFWMREYFDRYIRDRRHYEDVVRYIRNQGISGWGRRR